MASAIIFMKKFLSVFLGLGFLIPLIPITASAACSPVALGGTGQCNFTQGLLYSNGGTSAIQTTSTTTLVTGTGISFGGATPVILGSSPITISATGNGVTAVTGTWPILSSGGTTPVISWGGLSTTTNLTAGHVVYSSGAGSITDVATSTPTVTSPLTYSGTLGSFVGGISGAFACATCLIANQTITLSGDVTGSGATAITATLKNTGTAGTYRSTTFDAQGRETSGTNPTTFAGYAISDTSANLAAALTDETGGAGFSVFSIAPTFTGTSNFANSSSTVTSTSGETFSGTASTTNLIVSGIQSALHLGGTTGAVTAYAGTTCTNQFVRSLNGAGVATCNTVSLTSDVTGTLAIGNGGTGQITASAAFMALSPITSVGDIIAGGSLGTPIRVASGTVGQVLHTSAATLPSWSAVSLTVDVTGTLPVGNGGTGVTATSSIFTFGSGLNGTTGIFTQNEHRSFTYATSTTWTGTTTIPLETGYGELWNSVRCFTDTGTLNVDFYHSTNHLNFLNASTTNNVFAFTTNATITAGDKTSVDIGTPATSPTKINCTILDTY